MESCEEKQKWIQEVTASLGWGLWTLKTEAEHREDEEPLEVATTLDLVDASVFCTAGRRGTPSSNKGQVEEEGWLPSGDSSDFRSNLKESESTFINAPALAIFFKPIVAPTLAIFTKEKGF